ncbi:hypothetical protein QBC45DRAFT_486678 [Copromyces sp. CBS 386.78]|nr:hypothetical protein QBC45DRAFT_486678 [Copromyces sp. CBS 386.78]
MTIVLPIGFWFGDLTPCWCPLSAIRRHRRCFKVVPGHKEKQHTGSVKERCRPGLIIGHPRNSKGKWEDKAKGLPIRFQLVGNRPALAEAGGTQGQPRSGGAGGNWKYGPISISRLDSDGHSAIPIPQPTVLPCLTSPPTNSRSCASNSTDRTFGYENLCHDELGRQACLTCSRNSSGGIDDGGVRETAVQMMGHDGWWGKCSGGLEPPLWRWTTDGGQRWTAVGGFGCIGAPERAGREAGKSLSELVVGCVLFCVVLESYRQGSSFDYSRIRHKGKSDAVPVVVLEPVSGTTNRR